VKIVLVDISDLVDKLAPQLAGYETVVSTLGATQQLLQLNLVEAIAKIGTVKRFIPCGFTIICPRGRVMKLRDEKEEVHDLIFKHKIPYTIIDGGFWHQLSVPRLASGKVDYALIQFNNQPPKLYGDGNVKSMLIDKRDIGRYTARIVKDPRTLNKKINIWADNLSQNEIFAAMEEVGGEKVANIVYVSIALAFSFNLLEHALTDIFDLLCQVPAEQLIEEVAHARKAVDESKEFKFETYIHALEGEYEISKYIRGDNTPENAEYLGYIDAKKLYPDIQPITFRAYLGELFSGKGTRPYDGAI
jgi:hypothetical protein